MREYALVFCVAAAVTYLLTPLARRLAIRIGAMAQPRDRDVHAIPTPRLGGLAMYAGVCAAFMVAHQLPALSGVFRYSDVEAVTIAGGVIVVLGLVDDKWGIDALTKLAGQVVAAGIMVLLGLQLLTLSLPGLGQLSLGPEGVPLTVLLALLTVNAINFIDGLDGLAAGVGAIAALAFFAFSYSLSSGTLTHGVGQERISSPTLIAIVLAGVCLGFLPHNFNPARIFMGDSGSMLIGVLLAASTISTSGKTFVTAPGSGGKTALATYAPLVVLAGLVFVPLLDLLMAVVRRTRRGMSPFAPDKMHLHHRLLQLGHSHRRAVLLIYLWAAVLAVPFVDLLLAVVRRTRAGRSPFAPDKAHLHHRLLEIGHSHTRAVLIMYGWTALLAFGGVAVSVTGGLLPAVGVVTAVAALVLVASSVPLLRADRGRVE